ncbi:General alpha-glucoside permease [Talaromyces islandicus]|uniref:General alpha-glucoside permease n=1 Tax=Talaromyces islandicus TaxID=28573 RepID=A0A0U1M6Q8_TALIS|nr:General alpha-glucoside permease [Talaromyces islandicus]
MAANLKHEGRGEVEAVENVLPCTTDHIRDMGNDLGVWECLKNNPKAIFYSFLMSVGPTAFGFDNLVVGLIASMPGFRMVFGDTIGGKLFVPSLWLSLWNAMTAAGIVLGAITNGYVQDRFGRRLSFTLGGVIATVGIAICYISDRRDLLGDRRSSFLGGKIVLGVGLGVFQSTSQTYISEIAPARVRGPLLSSYTFMSVVGQLIGASIVYARVAVLDKTSYRIPLATQWAFSLAIIIIGLIIPESPVYYLKKNNIDNAALCYKRLYFGEDHSRAIAKMKETLDYEQANEMHGTQSSFLECFRGVNWRRTRIAILAVSLQQCLGMSYVGHSAYILQQAGMNVKKTLMLMQVAISVGLPANIISWFLMDTLGRRTIILHSTIAVGFLWLASGIAGCFPNSTALWFVGIAMIIIMFTFGLGVGGAYPVLAAEVSASQLRAHTQGIAYMTGGLSTWLFSFVVPYMFNTDEGNLGAKTSFIFAALCALGAIVVFFEFPETKARTYRELDEMFDQMLPARKFRDYVFPHPSRCDEPSAQDANAV